LHNEVNADGKEEVRGEGDDGKEEVRGEGDKGKELTSKVMIEPLFY